MMAKRRPNGGGTITKRKDGRYQGAAYVTNTEGHRVRKYAYGATYDEAAEKLAKLQDQERNGVPVPSRSWNVGEWLTYWLEQIVKANREYNTYAKYESKVRLYLLPHLAKKPLIRLTAAQVRKFMADLKREGVPAATRFEVLRVLRNALNRAIREEILTRNVALLVDMPKVSKGRASRGTLARRSLFCGLLGLTGCMPPAFWSWFWDCAGVRFLGCAGRTLTSRVASSRRSSRCSGRRASGWC